MDTTQGQKSELEAVLERNEQGINKLVNKIDTIEKALNTTSDKISSLTGKQKELLTVKSGQQYYIKKQIRAAYEIGSQEYLKVLLNQEDPNEIAKMLTYYDYFNQARSKQIESYNLTLLDLDRVTQELAEETVVLKSQRMALGTQQKSLANVQKEKQMTLKALINQISTPDQLYRNWNRTGEGLNNYWTSCRKASPTLMRHGAHSRLRECKASSSSG